jgi:hypothetical protein
LITFLQPDSIEQRIYNEIEAIVNLGWQGKNIPEDEKKIVSIFLTKSKISL